MVDLTHSYRQRAAECLLRVCLSSIAAAVGMHSTTINTTKCRREASLAQTRSKPHSSNESRQVTSIRVEDILQRFIFPGHDTD